MPFAARHRPGQRGTSVGTSGGIRNAGLSVMTGDGAKPSPKPLTKQHTRANSQMPALSKATRDAYKYNEGDDNLALPSM
jgi:hypothetical protein